MLKGFSGIYLYMTTDGFMKTTYKKSKTLKLIKNTKINKKGSIKNDKNRRCCYRRRRSRLCDCA